MKIFTHLGLGFLVAFSASTSFSAGDAYVYCRSKNPTDLARQISGTITDAGFVRVKFVEIDMWDEAIAPFVKEEAAVAVDATYRPRAARYQQMHRYLIIPQSTEGRDGIAVFLPKREVLEAQARATGAVRGSVQLDFDGVLRTKDDYGDVSGTQEDLKCGTRVDLR